MSSGWLLFAQGDHVAEHHVEPELWVTGMFTVLLVAMIAALAFEEKLHAKKSIIVGSFAGLCLLLATMLELLPFGTHHSIGGDAAGFRELVIESFLQGAGDELSDEIGPNDGQNRGQDRVGHDDLRANVTRWPCEDVGGSTKGCYQRVLPVM